MILARPRVESALFSWGESSGAISIALQMLANGGNTEGLFHAAFMNSGSPIPVGNLTEGQRYYDDLVEGTGCGNSSDTLQCLRESPYRVLKAAVDATPHDLSYQVRMFSVHTW